MELHPKEKLTIARLIEVTASLDGWMTITLLRVGGTCVSVSVFLRSDRVSFVIAAVKGHIHSGSKKAHTCIIRDLGQNRRMTHGARWGKNTRAFRGSFCFLHETTKKALL